MRHPSWQHGARASKSSHHPSLALQVAAFKNPRLLDTAKFIGAGAVCYVAKSVPAHVSVRKHSRVCLRCIYMPRQLWTCVLDI